MTERFPFEPLLEACEKVWREPNEAGSPITDVGKVASVLGVARSTVYKWQTEGLTEKWADRVAWLLGRHPGEVWPEWWSPGLAVA